MFFALWPDAPTREHLAEAASRLSWHALLHPVAPENYHVTLAFLGEVPPDRLPAVQQIAEEQRVDAFDIPFGGYDYWPAPQVVVVVANFEPPPLRLLCNRLRRDLTLSATEPFRAHVTLARKVPQAPVPKALSSFDWRARSFCLVHSEIRGARAVYTVVDTWSLLDRS